MSTPQNLFQASDGHLSDLPQGLRRSAAAGCKLDAGKRGLYKLRPRLRVHVSAYLSPRLSVVDPVLESGQKGAFRYINHTGDFVIRLTEFTNRAKTHAARVSLLSSSDSRRIQDCFQPFQSRSLGAQDPNLGSDTFSNVVAQSLEIEGPLVAKRVVHALATNTHSSEQVICGGAFEAPVAENLYGLSQGDLSVKFFRPWHGRKLSILDPSVQYGQRIRQQGQMEIDRPILESIGT